MVEVLKVEVGRESLHLALAGAGGGAAVEQRQTEARPEGVAVEQKQVVGEGPQLEEAAGNQQLVEAAGGENHQAMDAPVG